MKPFKVSELRRRMVYIAEQTLATPKGGEAFEALQCEIANIVAERDARIAELERIRQGVEDVKRMLFERNRAIAERDALITELEAAIDKLAQCKGRFHTEANFKALIAVREKNLHK